MLIKYSGEISYSWNKGLMDVVNFYISPPDGKSWSNPGRRNCTRCLNYISQNELWYFEFSRVSKNLKNKLFCSSCKDRFLNLPGNGELLAFLLAYDIQKTGES